MRTTLQLFIHKLAPNANQLSTYATSGVDGIHYTHTISVGGGDIGSVAGQPCSLSVPLSNIYDIHKSVLGRLGVSRI